MEPSPELQDILKLLPSQAGVYLMRDVNNVIIYVGKAKVLKNRVRSYFHGPKDIKTSVLVSRIKSIDWLVTRNEYEALILENNLIKEHKPRYNINLKDGKTYPVIRITNEDFPRVFRTRRIIDDGSQYFGPFPQLGALDQYLALVEKHFPLRKCRGPLKPRPKPCLYYHLKRCAGPCAGLVTKRVYKNQVENIKSLLSGEKDKLTEQLNKDMDKAAKSMHFEQAAAFRDSIRAIQALRTEQQITDFDTDSRDYIAWDVHDELVSFVVLRMRGGKMTGSDTFRTEGYDDAEDLAVQFFLQYYDEINVPPAQVYLVSGSMRDDLEQYCKEAFSLEVHLRSADSPRDSSILEMARENARQDMRKRLHESGNTGALAELQNLLELPRLPLRIEGFDIAHLHGKHTVAAMVSFYKGMPDKNHYRIFNIKSLGGAIDDYASLREALARRYTKVLNEELERPDLILIDGGKGQLHACMDVLDALGLGEIPIASLAKEDEEIFVPGRSEAFSLPEGSPALRILQHVRDESHRFGTSRNQNLRSGDLKLSNLEAMPGIGPKRAKELLQRFGSLEAIKEASLEDLASTARLGMKLAKQVHDGLGITLNDSSAEAAETALPYEAEEEE